MLQRGGKLGTKVAKKLAVGDDTSGSSGILGSFFGSEGVPALVVAMVVIDRLDLLVRAGALLHAWFAEAAVAIRALLHLPRETHLKVRESTHRAMGGRVAVRKLKFALPSALLVRYLERRATARRRGAAFGCDVGSEKDVWAVNRARPSFSES